MVLWIVLQDNFIENNVQIDLVEDYIVCDIVLEVFSIEDYLVEKTSHGVRIKISTNKKVVNFKIEIKKEI